MNEETNYQKRKQELLSLIKYLENRKQQRIEGKLRITPSGNKYKYYHQRKSSDNKTVRHYIQQKDLAIARALAQQEYEADLLDAARMMLPVISQRSTPFDPHALQNVYTNLHEARKVLVTPLVMSDEEYAEKWLDRSYSGAFFADGGHSILSEKGERVRSKSEKIIADKYYRMKIPYLYEFPLELRSGRSTITIHPDFTLLNKRTRRELFHEHFGMIDDPTYAEKFLKRLELYAENDIYVGETLLITMESSVYVLNEKLLNSMIDKYLL